MVKLRTCWNIPRHFETALNPSEIVFSDIWWFDFNNFFSQWKLWILWPWRMWVCILLISVLKTIIKLIIDQHHHHHHPTWWWTTHVGNFGTSLPALHWTGWAEAAWISIVTVTVIVIVIIAIIIIIIIVIGVIMFTSFMGWNITQLIIIIIVISALTPFWHWNSIRESCSTRAPARDIPLKRIIQNIYHSGRSVTRSQLTEPLDVKNLCKCSFSLAHLYSPPGSSGRMQGFGLSGNLISLC